MGCNMYGVDEKTKNTKQGAKNKDIKKGLKTMDIINKKIAQLKNLEKVATECDEIIKKFDDEMLQAVYDLTDKAEKAGKSERAIYLYTTKRLQYARAYLYEKKRNGGEK